MQAEERARESSVTDASSFSNPHEFKPKHIAIEWTVDFDKSVLVGAVTLDFEVLATAPTLVLDTRELAISTIGFLDENGGRVSASWSVRTGDSELGNALDVTVPPALLRTKQTLRCHIEYSTSPTATATQWLPGAQTAGGTHPYIFTQCQAIHARSLLPCMDAPGAKVTYEAAVRAPGWCTVLMSALPQEGAASAVHRTPDARGGTAVFRWAQPLKMSTYLIALCAGELESAELSPRCRVWAEPSVVRAAADEFADTETFLATTEELVGPYRWGRYDLVCLPPSFPYGGMENPCLTFVTPTLLAGDRSLADVVAHEIAHSWTGNLVTNATWEHFWLNEGWTIWVERTVMARVRGDPRMYDLRAKLGWKHLEDDVDVFSKQGKPQLTALVPPLDDQTDPDDAFSSVPYEKGSSLLRSLEQIVGAKRFARFARRYIDHFADRVVTSAAFKSFVIDSFAAENLDAPSRAKLEAFPWDTWYHKAGMPPSTPVFDDALARAAIECADAWLAAAPVTATGGEPLPGVNGAKFAEWHTMMKSIFLERLQSESQQRGAPLDVATLRALARAYSLDAVRNSEVRFRWQILRLKAGDADVLPAVVTFATEQGRMKFVRPLYREMATSPIAGGVAKALAISTFQAHADAYHPIARKMIAFDLGLDEGSARAGGPLTGLLAPRVLVLGVAAVALAAIVVGAVTRRR